MDLYDKYWASDSAGFIQDPAVQKIAPKFCFCFGYAIRMSEITRITQTKNYEDLYRQQSHQSIHEKLSTGHI